MSLRVDGLQYCSYSEKIFRQWNETKMSAVHVTIAYHEDFYQTIENISMWNRYFEEFPQWIFAGKKAEDIELAQSLGKTAVFFGLQNCSSMDGNIYFLQILYDLGVRFMQLTYNNQSLLAGGCFEPFDSGLSRMGKEVVREMNRLGMVVDMSHSGEKSTLEAIELSQKPIAITHANPSSWNKTLRSKSDTVLKSLRDQGGFLGLSLYSHHLKGKSECSLDEFCRMVAETVEMMGLNNVGIGSDLCQDQPNSVVTWMRNGVWTKTMDYGEGSKEQAGFLPQPPWFKDVSGFNFLEEGLTKVGFQRDDIDSILGRNWLAFYRKSFL